MNRSDLPELHYITTILNVPSILAQGILCHRQVQRFPHQSVAMPEIQDIRSKKVVPGGRLLHEYANLYLCARNPMLYKRKELHGNLCVLRVSTAVLDIPGTIIADGNAASDYTAFWPSPGGLARIDLDAVFAEFWTDNDQIVEWRKKRMKCAEALVPERVESRFILGAYASGDAALQALRAVAPNLDVRIDTDLFFR